MAAERGRIREPPGSAEPYGPGTVDRALPRSQSRDGVDDRLQVRRGRPTAAADDADAQFGHELALRLSQALGGERVDGPPVLEVGDTGVGHDAYRQPRLASQGAHVLPHVGRSGGTVHAQHVDRERVERRDGGRRLRTEQQGVDVLLDGELHDQRHAFAALDEHVVGGGDRGLDLEQVEAGLDEDHVAAAVEQPPHLPSVALLHHGDVDVVTGVRGVLAE